MNNNLTRRTRFITLRTEPCFLPTKHSLHPRALLLHVELITTLLMKREMVKTHEEKPALEILVKEEEKSPGK